MDAIAAMETCRAIRSFRPDPVPDGLVLEILRAATCAPSPENSQGWEFVVVRDPAVEAAMGDRFASAIRARRGTLPNNAMLRNVLAMAEGFGTIPVVVLVAGAPSYPPQQPSSRYLWATLYPAAQNLVVAARSLGLGTAFTMFHELALEEVKRLTGIPDGVHLAATIPMGWPAGTFGPVRRKPVEEVVHWDRWS
jgi:nitroreductase